MMRLSGSVKLRCDLGLGSSDGSAAGLPGFLRPSAWRCCSFSASIRRSSSRCYLPPTQSGISSPRLSLPKVSSSWASAASAAASIHVSFEVWLAGVIDGAISAPG